MEPLLLDILTEMIVIHRKDITSFYKYFFPLFPMTGNDNNNNKPIIDFDTHKQMDPKFPNKQQLDVTLSNYLTKLTSTLDPHQTLTSWSKSIHNDRFVCSYIGITDEDEKQFVNVMNALKNILPVTVQHRHLAGAGYLILRLNCELILYGWIYTHLIIYPRAKELAEQTFKHTTYLIKDLYQSFLHTWTHPTQVYQVSICFPCKKK